MDIVPHRLDMLLAALECPAEWADVTDAVGLVLEVRTPGDYVQWIGPFSAETVEIIEALQVLKSEEDLTRDEPNEYTVRPLFPPSFAVKPQSGERRC